MRFLTSAVISNPIATYQVAANSEAVAAALPVSSFIPGGELAIAKQRVRLRLSLWWELPVDGAAIDKQRCLGSRQVFLRRSSQEHSWDRKPASFNDAPQYQQESAGRTGEKRPLHRARSQRQG